MQAKEVNFSGKVVKDLKIIKLIGQGNWADVYLAQDTVSHQKFAVKVTPQNKLEQVPKLKQLIKAQIAILKQCKSPNVVRLFNNFVHQDHQFIVLEYCSGFELGDILLREKKLDEPTAVNYLKQILNGFKGLHEVGAMHRDFKAENVMLHQGLCKIVDLGFGKQLQGGELATTKLGSNLTMAPQVMQGLSYDFKADIWSIGVVFYQMLFGKFPFQARGPMAILQKARNQDYSLQSDEVSEQSKDFIAKCFKFDPEERIDWVDIYKHPLIAEQSHEVNMGLKDSKINVEENINFYLKKVKSDVSYPSDLGYSESNSQLRPKQQEKEKPNKQRQEEIIQNQPSQGLLNDVKEDQIKKEQIPYKPFPTQSSIRMLQMARNQQLSEQYLKAERLKVANAVKDIKYIYMQQLDNIQFISRYTIGAMQETARLGCTINHTPIICLLVKVAYKRLECLNDGINLQRNPFNVDYNSLKYFIEDQQFHEILKTHLKEFKNMFQHYRGFLSDELKDLRLLEATRDITNAASLPPQLLDEYLTSHAQMIVKSQFRGNQDIQCRLLKLSFCLSKYKKFKQDNFSKKRILKSLNNFNYARAYQEQQRRPIFNQIRRQIYAPPPPRPIFPFGIFQYGLRGIRFPW